MTIDMLLRSARVDLDKLGLELTGAGDALAHLARLEGHLEAIRAMLEAGPAHHPYRERHCRGGKAAPGAAIFEALHYGRLSRELFTEILFLGSGRDDILELFEPGQTLFLQFPRASVARAAFSRKSLPLLRKELIESGTLGVMAALPRDGGSWKGWGDLNGPWRRGVGMEIGEVPLAGPCVLCLPFPRR